MGYLNQNELQNLGLKSLGKNVKISEKAVIHNPDLVSIGDNSRIDDFCVISGKVNIDRYVHIAVFNNLAGGRFGINLEEGSALAYGCHLFAQTDDYSGEFLVSPLFDSKLTNVQGGPITIGRLSTIATASIILPNIVLGEGSAIGAMSIVNRNTQPWTISMGQPARFFKDRDRNALKIWKNLVGECEIK
jgi:galactoside O-acetyltransferase